MKTLRGQRDFAEHFIAIPLIPDPADSIIALCNCFKDILIAQLSTWHFMLPFLYCILYRHKEKEKTLQLDQKNLSNGSGVFSSHMFTTNCVNIS